MSATDALVDIRKANIESLTIPGLAKSSLDVSMLRLDKIHPVISGNKWFKLKNYFEEALAQGYQTIVTFGGAWSNHIIATACASKAAGLKSVGIIRGERPKALSYTLEAAMDYGMTLEFVSRADYALKSGQDFLTRMEQQFGSVFFIPEGGAGTAGVEGSKLIGELADLTAYSHIVCCVGTGTMITGLAGIAPPNQQLVGISVLKGVDAIPGLANDGASSHPVEFVTGYHFGGYAKKTSELLEFMNRFYLETGVPTDFVYTAKMAYAFNDLAGRSYFPAGSNILLIHSGGLQGNRSLAKGTLLF